MGVPDKLDKTRLKKIQQLFANGGAKPTNQIAHVPVDEETDPMEATDGELPFDDRVFEVPINELRFNPHNGRIGMMPKAIRRINQNSEENQEKFARYFLGELSPDDRKKIRRQLKADGQKTPIVALADGLVLDGNTRMASLLVDRKKTKINAFFLHKKLSMEEAQTIEWHYSYEETYEKQWSEFQRGNEILKQLRHDGKHIRPKPEEMQKLMEKDHFLNLLTKARLNKKDNDGFFGMAIYLVSGVLEAEEFVKRYNKKNKTNHPVDWIDSRDPGFTLMTTDVLPLLDKAIGKTNTETDVNEEALRKIAFSQIAASIDGEPGRVVTNLRDISSAASTDQEELITKSGVTANNCMTIQTARTVLAVAKIVKAQAAGQKKKNQLENDLIAIRKDLEKIKLSKINKNNKGKLVPIINAIQSRVNEIEKKINRV